MSVARGSIRGSSSSSRPAAKNRSPWSGAVAERVANVAKALGHPARVGIVRLLLERQTCIGCDIVEDVGLAQSTVSEHLRILRAAGIIVGEIERPRVCYSLDPEALVPLAELLDAIFEAAAHPVLGGSARSSAPEARRRTSGGEIRR